MGIVEESPHSTLDDFVHVHRTWGLAQLREDHRSLILSLLAMSPELARGLRCVLQSSEVSLARAAFVLRLAPPSYVRTAWHQDFYNLWKGSERHAALSADRLHELGPNAVLAWLPVRAIRPGC